MKTYYLFLLRAMLSHEKKRGIIVVLLWMLLLSIAMFINALFVKFLSEVSGADEYGLFLLTLVLFLPVPIAWYAAFFLLAYAWIALWIPWSGVDVDSLRQELRRVAGVS